MQLQKFKARDPIKILHFFSTFRNACDNTSRYSALTEIKERHRDAKFDTKTWNRAKNKKMKTKANGYSKLRTYNEFVNYVLRMY